MCGRVIKEWFAILVKSIILLEVACELYCEMIFRASNINRSVAVFRFADFDRKQRRPLLL